MIVCALRLGQLDLLKILLRFLVTHTNMATQSQESPVEYRYRDQQHQQWGPGT